MKTSVYIANMMALANELRAVVESTTPETFEAERDLVLNKFGVYDQLNDLTYG